MTDRTDETTSRPRKARMGWKARAGAGALALAVAGLLGAGHALAGAEGHHEHGMHGKHGSCMHGGRGLDRLEKKLQGLELNAETQASVKTVIDQARANQTAQRAQMRDAHEKMRTLLEQDAPDTAAVMAQADAIGALHTAARKEKLRTMLELRSLVGAERWKQLDFGTHPHERSS